MTPAQIQAALNADPMVQRLVASAGGTAARGSAGGSAQVELERYLRTQRPDLFAAIQALPRANPHSNGWGVMVSDGQLREGQGTPAWQIAATGAGMAAGAYGLGTLLGSAPAALPAAAPAATPAAAVPAAAVPAAAVPAAAVPAASSVPAAIATATGAAAPTLIDRIVRAASSPGGIATLASLTSMLAGGGGGSDNPFADMNVSNELSQTLALQRGRMEQAQPVYDTLVNMAYGMSPTRSRGAAPAGYTPNPAPSGAYQYQAPRFGGG